MPGDDSNGDSDGDDDESRLVSLLGLLGSVF